MDWIIPLNNLIMINNCHRFGLKLRWVSGRSVAIKRMKTCGSISFYYLTKRIIHGYWFYRRQLIQLQFREVNECENHFILWIISKNSPWILWKMRIKYVHNLDMINATHSNCIRNSSWAKRNVNVNLNNEWDYRMCNRGIW